MSQLVAYYDEKPVALKGQVEIHQQPLAAAAGVRCVEGAVRSSLVYVQVPSEAGPFLVPFGEYDDWSLRDRYNEAIRIMNTLGASEITCETFGEVAVRRGVRAKVMGRGAEVTQQRIENSGFDFRHSGAGSAPRDPRPLRWPDEPGFAAAVSSVLDNAPQRWSSTSGATARTRPMAPSRVSSRGLASTSEAARSDPPRQACTSARPSRRDVGAGGRTAATREPAAASVSMTSTGWHARPAA